MGRSIAPGSYADQPERGDPAFDDRPGGRRTGSRTLRPCPRGAWRGLLPHTSAPYGPAAQAPTIHVPVPSTQSSPDAARGIRRTVLYAVRASNPSSARARSSSPRRTFGISRRRRTPAPRTPAPTTRAAPFPGAGRARGPPRGYPPPFDPRSARRWPPPPPSVPRKVGPCGPCPRGGTSSSRRSPRAAWASSIWRSTRT